MESRVKEYTALRQYFEAVAHHNTYPDHAQFVMHVERLESFLLEALQARTAESFSEIERLIEEGEKNA